MCAVRLWTGISSTLSTGTGLFQGQVFQLKSNGTYASSLPKAGYESYHLNHRVGTCSPMANNRETMIHHRETPFRPGPHPNRSECNSSGHRFIDSLTNPSKQTSYSDVSLLLNLTLRIPLTSWLYGLGVRTLQDLLVPR